MSTVPKKSVGGIETEGKNLTPSLIAETSTLPDKFFTFTHEGISMIWLNETPSKPIRGIRPEQK